LKEKAMKHVVLTLAAVAIVGFAANLALAGNGHRSYSGHVEYHGYHEYSGSQYSGNLGGYYDRGYRGSSYPSSSRYSRGYESYGYTPSFGMSHGEAVRRIMAKHSRSRYHTHPRSMYNGPPSYR
jgi:hypothetical protein